MPKNIELKARTEHIDTLRKILLNHGAVYKGTDLQQDTYFHVNEGRLKLREGNVENNLIHYQRQNTEAAKFSEVLLHKPSENKTLKLILDKTLGISVVVNKAREIYFIENVKFHLDKVENLGTFIEIEAIDTDETYSLEELTMQCRHYQDLLHIMPKDLRAYSYSDMLLQLQAESRGE